jgi:hypothetical protein
MAARPAAFFYVARERNSKKASPPLCHPIAGAVEFGLVWKLGRSSRSFGQFDFGDRRAPPFGRLGSRPIP